MPSLSSLLPPISETASTQTGPAPASPNQTGAAEPGPPPSPAAPHETSIIVSGTPTGVFAEVAQGALGCWLGPGGPLKASHVYRAEADPPAKGGDAEIVLHERDTSLRDQRGPRAYRVAFASEASGVRVTATALRFEAKLAEVMAQDVAGWAKESAKAGGCRLRALLPPPAAPGLAKAPPAKTTKSVAQAAKAPAQKSGKASAQTAAPAQTQKK
jgi:hypothetical protein